jgi:hypothetical protein
MLDMILECDMVLDFLDLVVRCEKYAVALRGRSSQV